MWTRVFPLKKSGTLRLLVMSAKGAVGEKLEWSMEWTPGRHGLLAVFVR